MNKWTWILGLGWGLCSAEARADELPFCACTSSPCAQEPGADEPACITFDEAADLAAQPGSTTYKLTTTPEPNPSGAVQASALDANAICQYGVCYVRGDGRVSLAAYGHQTVFFGWSGCSESTAPHLELGPLTASSECVAHFGPGLIVADTHVEGRDDGAKVHIDGSCQGSGHCSFLNGGSVTLRAPPSDARFAFVGWSGCSNATEPSLTFTDVRQALPACTARYVPAAPVY
jgi:hypothetical protein